MYRKPEIAEMNPEERDARTVVCMQLASRIRSEDLEEFFSSVGKVTSPVLVVIRHYTDRLQWSCGNVPDCGLRGPRFESHCR